MKHYTEQEWQAFKQGLISQPESETMESHLLDCDQCTNLFLHLVDEIEIARAGNFIPSGFSQTAMTFIKQNQGAQPSTTRHSSKIKKLFSYYVVAAAITLLLVSGGVFQSAVTDISALPTMQIEKQPDNLFFTWPNRLVEKSSSWTHLFPAPGKNLKEVIW